MEIVGFPIPWKWKSSQDKAEAKAAKIFSFLDLDGNGEIDETEFIEGCMLDEELVEILGYGYSGVPEEGADGQEIPKVTIDGDKNEISGSKADAEKCI